MIRLTAVIEVEGHAPRAITHESNARSIVLGRDASADFQLPLSTISRQHARISETDNVYVIEDLGSTHGTLLNGKKLESGQKKVLRNGDVLEISKAKITCAIEQEKVASGNPGEGTQALAARAVQGILGRLGEANNDGPFLRIIAGVDEGARLPLGGTLSEWALGRSKDCECVLNDPNVSRRHAIIKKDWNGFIISDLGSKNGVLINDQQIARPRRLKDGDEITIGPVKLIFIDPDADLLAALKGVPGFDVDEGEAEPMASNPSHVGAPQDEDGEAEDGMGVHPLAAPPEYAAQPEEDEMASIDPALLISAEPRLPVDWLVIGGVGVLVVASAIALFLILG